MILVWKFCQTPLQLADPTQLQFVGVGVDFVFPLDRGEHFPELAKNHWGKVPNFWDLGKSSMKFNSTHVVAIWDGEVLITWRGNFSEFKE